MAAKRKPVTRRVGAFSTVKAIALADGRTPEAYFIRKVAGSLVDQFGGPDHVTASMGLLIRHISTLEMRANLLANRLTNGEDVTESLDEKYRLLIQSIGRELERLESLSGQWVARPVVSLTEYLELKRQAEDAA